MANKFFFKHFPPPKFLSPNILGLSFSDSSLRMIEIGGRTLKSSVRVASFSFDAGVVVSGSIAKPEYFTRAILDLAPKFGSKFVSVSIPDEVTYVYNISISLSNNDQNLYDKIAFSIEENVPLSSEEVVFDFVPVSVIGNKNDKKVNVIVFACVKKEIEKIVDCFLNTPFEVLGCVPESQATALSVVPNDLRDTNCIINVAGNKISIYLVEDRIVRFSTLNVLSNDYESECVSEYQKFIDYLQKHLSFNKNVSDKSPIKNVFLCGDFDYIKQIIEPISNLSLQQGDVVLSNVWGNLFNINNYKPNLPFESSLSFASAIGSILK